MEFGVQHKLEYFILFFIFYLIKFDQDQDH